MVNTPTPSSSPAVTSPPLDFHGYDAHDAGGIDPLSPNSGVIPVGGIIMWNKASTLLPANWKVCDGTNGTPNLVDKFVKGVGAEALGVTGGAATGTQTLAHTNNHATGTEADHNHHTHGMTVAIPNVAYVVGGSTLPGSVSTGNESPDLTHAGHTHTAHGDHSVSVAILPSYYTLYYIMRIF